MTETQLAETIKVRLKPASKKALAERAQAEGLNISDIARRAIQEFISRSRRRKP